MASIHCCAGPNKVNAFEIQTSFWHIIDCWFMRQVVLNRPWHCCWLSWLISFTLGQLLALSLAGLLGPPTNGSKEPWKSGNSSSLCWLFSSVFSLLSSLPPSLAKVASPASLDQICCETGLLHSGARLHCSRTTGDKPLMHTGSQIRRPDTESLKG